MRIRIVLGISVCLMSVVVAAGVAIILQEDTPARAFVDDFGAELVSSLCLSPATESTKPTFASEIAAANERMHSGMAITPTGNPDRDFALMMIPHHQGAIDMALVQLKYGKDKTLRRLAQVIIVEQAQEIAYMRALIVEHQGGTASGNPSTANQWVAQ